MAFTLRPRQYFRSFYNFTRNYCDNKSIYQRNEEEAQKSRTVYGQPYPEWRKPWIKREGEFKTKLSVFVEKNPSPDILYIMSKIPEFNMKVFKKWWADMKILQEIENQKYLQERVTILGSNLAAIHFFAYRGAAVRLKNDPRWIQGDITTLKLPDRFVEGYFVEAVDCSKFHHNGLRYEGIQNLQNVNLLKWLSLKNNKFIDVWCLDRIAGQNGQSIEFLDISGCKLCTGGVVALSRMSALQYLVITDPGDDVHLQAALSMLEQERPGLLIKAIDPEPE